MWKRHHACLKRSRPIRNATCRPNRLVLQMRPIIGRLATITLLVGCGAKPMPACPDCDPATEDGSNQDDAGDARTLQPVMKPPPFEPARQFSPPVRKVTQISSTFGPRWKTSDNRDEFHLGIDYYDVLGTPLLAIGNGTVAGVYPAGS